MQKTRTNPSSSATKTRQILSGFLLLRKSDSRAIKHGDPKRYFCTFGEKEHTSKRVSIIACNNVISKTKCATRTRLCRRTPYHGDDRKRREKQALAFAEIERSGHSQQPDTKCQMQGISAKARLLSVDASLLRVNSLAPLLNESSSSAIRVLYALT